MGYVDNTALLKATIKAVRLRESNVVRRRRTPSTNEPESKNEAGSVVGVRLEGSPNYRLHADRSRLICQHIKELVDLVLETRQSYLMSSVNIYGHSNFMSDADRRQFDTDTDRAMKQCAELVRNFEEGIKADESLLRIVDDQKILTDEFNHLIGVAFLLSVYLKEVCRIVTELRAIYLKKSQKMNQICRLGNLVNLYDSQIAALREEHRRKDSEFRHRHAALQQGNDGWEDVDVELPSSETKLKKEFSASNAFYEEEKENEPHVELTNTEQQQLTMENTRLLENLTQRNSEIEQIETQFAELQKLQQTFTEKVLEQERDIEIIHSETIHTLDNLDQANEFIREAIKNSASRRVIALFCLIVLTFTLLFLDWYNP